MGIPTSCPTSLFHVVSLVVCGEFMKANRLEHKTTGGQPNSNYDGCDCLSKEVPALVYPVHVRVLWW